MHVLRLFVLLPLPVLVLLAAACGGGSATPAPTATSDEATVAPTAATEADPTPIAAGDGPTGPGPAPGTPCPVARAICDFAVEVESALKSGDASRFFASASPVQATCPAGPGSGGPSEAVCAGAVSGETRQGFWALRGGEGQIVSRDELQGALAHWLDTISRAPATSDVYGPAELRIGSISCTRRPDQASGSCIGNSIQVHFTFINPPDAQGTGIPGGRISFHVSASLVDGVPRANGFGTVVPPNSVLVGKTITIRDGQGNPLLVEVYPWTR